ncbi:hypothetical protein [Mycolicibacterium hodleri]
MALLAASGVVIAAWAVFPSFVESRVYVPLPQASDPTAVDAVDHPGQGVVERFVAQAVFKTMSASGPTNVRIGLESSSRSLVVQQVPLRSKLTALLALLSQTSELERPALEAKIRALLELPDVALAQLLQHPDLADLSKTLDAVFLGTSDVSQVKTELDKITVTSVPGESEKIHVIAVSGKPAYEVRTPISAVPSAMSVAAMSVAPVAPQVDEPSATVVTTFALEPSVDPLPPPPPPPPVIEQARFAAPAIDVAPSVDDTPPPPPPSPTPAPEPAAQSGASTEVTGTSLDVMDSGNKFEPGETAAQPVAGNSPTTEATASQTSSPPEPTEPPSTGATAVNEPAGDGGKAAPSGGGSAGEGDQ